MRILVIRFSSLGDVVLAAGVLRALGQSLPGLDLTFVCKPAYQPLFEHLDVPLECCPADGRQPLVSAWRELKRYRFDGIVDLHASIRSVLLSRLLRARKRAQVAKNVTQRRNMVRYKRGLDRPLSVLRTYCDAVKPWGVKPDDCLPRLFLSREEQQRAEKMRADGDCPYRVGIGWGARWPTKAVPAGLWSAILAEMTDENGPAIHLFGEAADSRAMAAFVDAEQKLRPRFRFHAECGHHLREVMVRLAACDVFVSSDSGLMHVAAALGIPTLGLFGPTHPAFGFAPVGNTSHAFHAGTSCSPCHRHGAAPCHRGHRYCFDELDARSIAATIRASLSAEGMADNVKG